VRRGSNCSRRAIVDPVKARLGANEQSAVGIQLEAAAQIDVEVVAGSQQLATTATVTLSVQAE